MRRKPLNPGEKFDRLTVLKDLGARDGKSWSRVRCDCGKEFNVANTSLRTGVTKSCGCLQRERVSERSIRPLNPGQKFGRLTVLKDLGALDGQSWSLVRCTCGRKFKVRNYHLRIGDIKSCGCLRRERTSERSIRPLAPSQKFGRLTVLKDLGARSEKSWSLVRCACGRKFKVRNHDLRKGHTKSCGHHALSAPEELFGRILETVGFKPLSQFPFGRFWGDFYLKLLNLIMEYNGCSKGKLPHPCPKMGAPASLVQRERKRQARRRQQAWREGHRLQYFHGHDFERRWVTKLSRTHWEVAIPPEILALSEEVSDD